MEFPHLGKNCSYKSCNRLDFLPLKCGACQDVFCSDHFAYAEHKCRAPNTRDVQVPVCPLCEKPVPVRRGEAPVVAVGDHIQNMCVSDRAANRKKKVFTNRCSYKGCKTKEMVPLVSSECSSNYCIQHRHTADHACAGKTPAAYRIHAVKSSLASITDMLRFILGLLLQFALLLINSMWRIRGATDRTWIEPIIRNPQIRPGPNSQLRSCRTDSLLE